MGGSPLFDGDGRRRGPNVKGGERKRISCQAKGPVDEGRRG